MLSESEYGPLVEAFPFFANLAISDQDAIRDNGVRLALPQASRAFGVGGVCESFLFVTEGQVRVSMTSAEGRELLLYRIRPGESCVLTTSCLMGGQTYPADGVAEIATIAIAIPQSLFEQLISRAGPFREFVFSTFSGRITTLMGLVEEVAFNRLDRRIAKYLLNLNTESVTHHAIASELGTVREIVSRILKSFQSEGIVRLSRNRVEILQREKLQGFLAG